MPPIFIALDAVSEGYTRFEKDQVLNEAHLNSVAAYADDAPRLTRVKLLGCGVLRGLRASWTGRSVQLSPGVGVTSDGDLVFFDGQTTWTHFRPFVAKAGHYRPFQTTEASNGAPALYELLAKDAARAKPMSQFAVTTGLKLSDVVALLYVDSHVTDRDLCSGDDCDNLGKEVLNPRHLLLTDLEHAEALTDGLAVPHRLWETGLEPFDVQRPLLGVDVTTEADLAEVYRAACSLAAGLMRDRLPALAKRSNALLGAFDEQQDFSAWAASLAALEQEFTQRLSGLQYYYGLLKDLADTANALIDALYDDRLWAHDDVHAFPKHLLLGRLSATTAPEPHRTPWFPSPAAQLDPHLRARARFLLNRLDAQLASFALPEPLAPLQRSASTLYTVIDRFSGERLRLSDSLSAPDSLRRDEPRASLGLNALPPIRITPSAMDDTPLGDRAMPAYYSPATLPVHERWSYEHAARGRSHRVQSFNAARHYAKDTRTMEPLRGPIGGVQLFRVEGHQGQQVERVLSELRRQITTWNLPFAVKALALSEAVTDVIVDARKPYTTLHKLHHVLRKDLAAQLEQVEAFAGSLTEQVRAKKVELDRAASVAPETSFLGAATEHKTKLQAEVPKLVAALKSGPRGLSSDAAFKTSLSEVLRASGGLQQQLSEASRNNHVTPADMVLSAVHPSWLGLLERHIDADQTLRDQRLLFSEFLRQHPGVEHFAGVPRGGTFLLVYTADGVVVADFAIPTICCEPELQSEDEREEPEDDVVLPYEGGVLHGGVTIELPMVARLQDASDQVRAAVMVDVAGQLREQAGVAEIYKDAFSSLRVVSDAVSTNLTAGLPRTAVLDDSVRAAPVVETREPQPVVVDRQPDPVVVDRQPDPVVVDRQPDPVVVDRQPDPVVEERLSQPLYDSVREVGEQTQALKTAGSPRARLAAEKSLGSALQEAFVMASRASASDVDGRDFDAAMDDLAAAFTALSDNTQAQAALAQLLEVHPSLSSKFR